MLCRDSRSVIEVSDPTFEWRNYLRNYEEPKVSPVVVDAGNSMGVPAPSVLLLAFALVAATLAVRAVLLARPVWTAVSGASVVAAVLLVRVGLIDVANPFAGPPDDVTSKQILSAVLANVNYAYLEKEPDILREALATVVAADGLTDVEHELGRALAIKVAGGGIARIAAIENMVLEDITSLEGQFGFRALAEWNVQASAGHWGHTHRRTVRFRALVELVDDESTWKLAGITVVDAKQMN